MRAFQPFQDVRQPRKGSRLGSAALLSSPCTPLPRPVRRPRPRIFSGPSVVRTGGRNRHESLLAWSAGWMGIILYANFRSILAKNAPAPTSLIRVTAWSSAAYDGEHIGSIASLMPSAPRGGQVRYEPPFTWLAGLWDDPQWAAMGVYLRGGRSQPAGRRLGLNVASDLLWVVKG